ncbi:MAG: alginate lyase family protein [Sphingomonadaceae bacterium]
MIKALDRRAPRFAFARHLPPARIATRMLRRMQRRLGLIGVRGQLEAKLHAPGALPAPVFEPRTIGVTRDKTGWSFAFLGETHCFGSTIDWQPSGCGQLWRMNLHYFEYLETLPFSDGLGAIEQWIDAYPPNRAGAFYDGWNPYALSLRVVCWLQWLAQHDGVLQTSVIRDRIGGSLAQQLDWLAHFLETDLGGNHLIKNIKALLWGAACFEGNAARAWHKVGAALLRNELPRQIMPDGYHYERTPAYHNQVTADLIECRHVAPGLIDDALIGRMVNTALVTTHPDGNPAQFGDTGLTMAYPAGVLAEVIGCRSNEPRSAILPEAGIAALHCSPFTTQAKFGVLGARTLPAHAHGDIGSFELSVHGRRCIVDQGVYEYMGGDRRDASRRADMHNLLAPAESDLADFFGEFRCGWWPTPHINEAGIAGDVLQLDVSHDGFAHAYDGAIVRRVLRADQAALAIEDSLERLPAGGDWASRLLIHPDWRVRVTEFGALLDCEESEVRLETAAGLALEDAVWWPDMGVELPTTRIVLSLPAGESTLAFRLVAGK